MDINRKRRSVDPTGAGTPPPIKRMRAPTGNSNELVPEVPQPGAFVELAENVYSGDVSKEMLLANYQPSWCKCETRSNGGVCGKDCTNRRNRVECDPTLCVAGDKCGNQVIQRRSVVHQLEVVSKDGQPVLITQNPIPEGCFIIQYTGEVMSSQSFQQRVASYGDRPTFCLPMTRDLVIDASIKGSVCRYVRHSVQPTAEMVRWKAGGLDCMVLFSLRNIDQGEEITFDPSKVTFDGHTENTSEARCTVCREALGSQMAGGDDLSLPHPLLGVAICAKCLLAYTQREWVPDQNGKDSFCRWCSQPGNLLVCHSCPMSFCKKCLKSNLGHKTVRQAELKADTWQCIVCDSSSLDKLRGIVSGSTTQPQKQDEGSMGLGNLFKEEQKPTLTPVRRQRGGATGSRGRGGSSTQAGMGPTSSVRTPAPSQGVPPTSARGTPVNRLARGAGYKGTPRPARGQMSLARGAATASAQGTPASVQGAPPLRGAGPVTGRGLPQTRGRGGVGRGGSTAGVRGTIRGIRPVAPTPKPPAPVNNQLMGVLAKSGISVSRQVVKQPSAANNNANMAKLQQALPRGISIMAVSESSTQCNEMLKEVEEVANSIKEEAGNLRRDRDKQINVKDIKHLVIKAQRKLEDLALKM